MYYGLSTPRGTGHASFDAPVNSLESVNSSLPIADNCLANNFTEFVVSTGNGPAFFIGQGESTLSLTTSASSIAFKL